MKFTVVTLFPRMIESFCSEGLIGQARHRGLVDIQTLNPRDFTLDVHRTVDDRAFGGADGMVMKVEPLAAAVDELKAQDKDVRVAVLTPQGRPWTQDQAKTWAQRDSHVALICGRYAGIDERFVSLFADEEISVGDFILNGGELGACAVIESVSRLRPGVLGNQVSSARDSFVAGILECPQFTRPQEVLGLPVPAPLLSGHHQQIAGFERSVAVIRTALRRPDLINGQIHDVKAGVTAVKALSDLELRSLGIAREDLERLSEMRW